MLEFRPCPDKRYESLRRRNKTVPAAGTPRLAEVRKILKEVPLIDGHNDVPWQYRKRSNDFSAINLREDTRKLKNPMVTDIPRLGKGAWAANSGPCTSPPL